MNEKWLKISEFFYYTLSFLKDTYHKMVLFLPINIEPLRMQFFDDLQIVLKDLYLL